MAIYDQIEEILQAEVKTYNRDRDESKKKKAEVVIPKGDNPGRGNGPYGMHYIYNICLHRLLPETVVSVLHDEGDAYFPASAIIRLHSSSRTHHDEPAISAEHLAARLRAILATEEWDAASANES